MRILPIRNEIKEMQKAESPIEELLLRELHLLGLYPTLQFKVVNYRIDLAFPEFRVGIECDGKEWHSTLEQIAYDTQREEFLESMGWTIIRFSGSEIYKNADSIAKFLAGKRQTPFRNKINYRPIKEIITTDKEIGLELEQEIEEIKKQRLEGYEEDYYNKHKNDNFFSLKETLNLRYNN